MLCYIPIALMIHVWSLKYLNYIYKRIKNNFGWNLKEFCKEQLGILKINLNSTLWSLSVLTPWGDADWHGIEKHSKLRTYIHTHTNSKLLGIMMSFTLIQNNWFEIFNKSGKNMNSCKLDKSKTTYVSGILCMCMAVLYTRLKTS